MTDVTAADSGHAPVPLVAAIITLAALDLAGAILAKQWALHRAPMLFALGAVSFLGLFAVYALTLRVADLSTVTFGWIVCLQVAVLVVERTHYGVRLPPPKWLAIVAILLLQAYLVLAPNGERTISAH
jgi:hypothetical protein